MRRSWLLNIGRRDACTRAAHLLCELTRRMRAIGRCHEGSFGFPVTRIELADAMSVSSVHMNRAIQLLRSDGLVRIDGKTITIHDWERLAEVSDFDPAYRYLDGQPRSEAALS